MGVALLQGLQGLPLPLGRSVARLGLAPPLMLRRALAQLSVVLAHQLLRVAATGCVPISNGALAIGYFYRSVRPVFFARPLSG